MAAFSITSGALGQVSGSPFVTSGNAPYTLAALSTKFLYAGIPATSQGGVITRVLRRTLRGSVSGGIMLMPIKSDHTLDSPQMVANGDYDPIAVTPSGTFLYAADLTTNHVAAFSIDSSKGTLNAIGPQGGIAVGPDPFNIVVDPRGKFVFVANCDCRTNPQNHGSVQVFSIDTDGTLAAVGTFVPGGVVTAQPVALALSPDSKFLFVASLDDKVYVESIASNGVLSDAISGMPAVSLPPGSTPLSIAVSIDGGNTVYTGNAGTHTISFFLNCTQTPLPMVAKTSTGCPTDASGNATAPLALQATGGATVGGAVGVIVPDPTSIAGNSTTGATAIALGHFLYVTDYDHGTIVVFSVTSTTTCTTTSCPTTPGTLTQSGSAVNTGGANPVGLAVAH